VDSNLVRAFFEDLAVVEDAVPGQVRQALTDPAVPVWVGNREAVERLRALVTTPDALDALAAFAGDLVHIAVHSVLVAIDGGTASAEIGVVQLVDEVGESFPEGLHEHYVDHLFATGRRH
jgi:hypothetical protein